LIETILGEARSILCRLGVQINNDRVLALLSDHGARIDGDARRAWLNDEIVDRALASAPGSVALHDVLGGQTHDLSGFNVHFTPGSAAISILDENSGVSRVPATNDYVRYVKLASRLDHLASQSTALVPQDVPDKISDSYRLYLSLMYGEKPVVTGAFTIEAFDVMKAMQLAVRGTPQRLAARPLTVFSCCPTAPLKWSDVTSQNVVDCATHSIPVEFISMPLAGFVAPVTLVGTLVQHTAETLSGVVISQLTKPGAPILYGGSPAIFDVRYETTPMGAVETMMICCAYNEICGMALRALRGMEPREDFPAQPRFEELLAEKHLLISQHTRRHLRQEHLFPGPVIDRANRPRWQEEGSLTLRQRARAEVQKHVDEYEPSRLPDSVRAELTTLMEREARRHGMDRLPSLEP
jgi:trimethylamine--corrinoid protein Co-methyltransferase